jgi:putative serine protease PepD
MDRLWTDGPPTQTYDPPPPRQPVDDREGRPPGADRASAGRGGGDGSGGGGGRPRGPREPGGGSRWLAAVGGGTVSAVVVAAVLLGTGLAGGDNTNAPASTPTTPVATGGSANDSDLVRGVYAAASPSVVSVRTGSGSGTGFLVESDGTIVTNAHVVGDASQVQVRFSDDGPLHDARVLGVDASTDLAAIKVDENAAEGVRPLRLADSGDVQVGDAAVAIGYPLGLDRTATAGIVSGLERQIQAPNGFSIDKVIQTDAPINPGNSGGPLLNASGEVIGVNSQIATAGGSGGSVGIGFAVPANTVREVLPQLERGATPEHPYLGLSTTAVSGGGAQVQQATAGGPAQRAGLEPGDVVTRVDGDTVQSPDDVAAAIDDNQPGDEIDVTVRRGGDERTVTVTLGKRPAQVP